MIFLRLHHTLGATYLQRKPSGAARPHGGASLCFLDGVCSLRTLTSVTKTLPHSAVEPSELDVAIATEARLRRRYQRRGRAIPHLRTTWSVSTALVVALGIATFLRPGSPLLLALLTTTSVVCVLSIVSVYVLDIQHRRLASQLPDAMNSISRIRLAARR
jgi:hypothetical protein